MKKLRRVLDRHEASGCNQIEAADLLGITGRMFRRWCQRDKEDGEARLLDRRSGGILPKRVPPSRASEVEVPYRMRYCGFTARHCHEHPARDRQFTWAGPGRAARTGAGVRAVRCPG